MLVAVGSALFTMVGAYGFSDFNHAGLDPTASPPRSSPASASSAPA